MGVLAAGVGAGAVRAPAWALSSSVSWGRTQHHCEAMGGWELRRKLAWLALPSVILLASLILASGVVLRFVGQGFHTSTMSFLGTWVPHWVGRT